MRQINLTVNVAHYLEHFEPTSLSVSEEVNFSRESSFYQLGRYSRFNKDLLQREAGKFALKLLEARLLSILKGEVAARRALQRGRWWSAQLLQRLCDRGADTRSLAGCSVTTLPQAISTTIFLSTCYLYLCAGQIYLMNHKVHISLGTYLGVQRRAEGIAITVKPAATSMC